MPERASFLNEFFRNILFGIPLVRLIADTLGPMTPSTYFDGNVHSIFERLVNIKLFDGSFVSLGRNDISNGPGIIKCQANNNFDYSDYLNTDEICACRGGIMRVGQHFQVDLRSAYHWQRRIGVTKSRGIPTRWKLYLEYVHASKSFNWVNDIIGNPNQYLGNFLNMEANLGNLVGKGPGLTPLGDDFIIGMAASMETQTFSQGLLANWLSSVYSKTTELSGRALFFAAQGWFAEPLIDFVNDIYSMETKTDAIKLLSIGDTSGIAMAYGSLLGIHARSKFTSHKQQKSQNYTNGRNHLNRSSEVKAV